MTNYSQNQLTLISSDSERLSPIELLVSLTCLLKHFVEKMFAIKHM